MQDETLCYATCVSIESNVKTPTKNVPTPNCKMKLSSHRRRNKAQKRHWTHPRCIYKKECSNRKRNEQHNYFISLLLLTKNQATACSSLIYRSLHLFLGHFISMTKIFFIRNNLFSFQLLNEAASFCISNMNKQSYSIRKQLIRCHCCTLLHRIRSQKMKTTCDVFTRI